MLWKQNVDFNSTYYFIYHARWLASFFFKIKIPYTIHETVNSSNIFFYLIKATFFPYFMLLLHRRDQNTYFLHCSLVRASLIALRIWAPIQLKDIIDKEEQKSALDVRSFFFSQRTIYSFHWRHQRMKCWEKWNLNHRRCIHIIITIQWFSQTLTIISGEGYPERAIQLCW